jgi:hypothetical protein
VSDDAFLGKIPKTYSKENIQESTFKSKIFCCALWLMPVTLATREMEIGRVTFQGQPKQKVHKTLSQPVIPAMKEL